MYTTLTKKIMTGGVVSTRDLTFCLSHTDSWVEYILYRGLYRTSYARISRSTVTDTEMQVAQFVLPRHGRGVTNDTESARYLRSRKEGLPPQHVRLPYLKSPQRSFLAS